MRLERPIFILTACLTLVVLHLSKAAASSFLADQSVVYGESVVRWCPSFPDSDTNLTINGPAGLCLKRDYRAGRWPDFSVVDELGQPHPDGLYRWELIARVEGSQAEGQANRSRDAVQSGWFLVQRGRIIAAESRDEEGPIVVEEDAPQNAIYLDREGRVGVGTSVPGAQLHVKGTNPGLAIEDTRPGGHAYVLRPNENDGSLGLFDETAGSLRWMVDAGGRVGINTTEPTSTLTVDGYIESTKGFLVNGRPLPTYAPLEAIQPLYTEMTFNNFFGTGAGASITTGDGNAFFGGDAGHANTSGIANAFFGYNSAPANTSGSRNVAFGRSAGRNNTSGSNNAFLGDNSGYSNTVESNNAFIGASSDLFPGPFPLLNPVTNATAVGYRAYVSRSNSLVLGGVNGFNGATAETNVGIGTPNPDRQLVVEGSQALGKFRRYNETTPTHGPAFLFERGRGTNLVPLDMLAGDYLGKVQFRGRVGGDMREYGAFVFIASDMGQNGRFSFVDRDLVTERVVVLNTGNVGIGTVSPTSLLDVAGDLRVRGAILYGAPATPVPDYVFEPGFRLMPISELEQYVRREKHLPNVPKATEIQEKGVNLGEFQMKLLEKVEELTLYTVEQAKVIERQGNQIRVLEQLVKQLLDNR